MDKVETGNTPESQKPPGKAYKYGPEDKLQYEVEKITEEVRLMKKPYLQPTFWIGIIALTVSLAGNIGQSLTYESRAIIARADVAQAKLDRIDMESKRDEAKSELNALQTELGQIKEGIGDAKLASNSEEVKAALSKVEQKVTNLEESTQKTADTLINHGAQNYQAPKTPQQAVPSDAGNGAPSNRLQAAQAKEREGFQNLVSGNYGAAAAAFQAAENAYPSYHNVYELARFIRSSQSQMNDPEEKRQVFKTIVGRFSYGAPPDLWKQVVAISNE